MTPIEIIKSVYNPMFASRETLEEAYVYVQDVAKESGNSAAVWVAVQVVVNTLAVEMERALEEEENKRLRDLQTIKIKPMIPMQDLRIAFMAKTELEKIVEGWHRDSLLDEYYQNNILKDNC